VSPAGPDHAAHTASAAAAPDVIDLWLIRTDQPGPVLGALAALLDAAEQDRAARMLFGADRRRFTAARGAARLIIGARLGVAPRRLGWAYGPHGKPELTGAPPGTTVSFSHAGDVTALALTSRRAVGVDLQGRPARLDVLAMSARYYPAAEAAFVAAARDPDHQVRRFLTLWARKEACVKVAGGRLVPGLALPVRAAGQAAGPVLVTSPGGYLPEPCLVRDIPAPAGCRAAVAAAGPAPFRVARRWWHGLSADGAWPDGTVA
jgi:4'-phosphopantetheinyl transferase